MQKYFCEKQQFINYGAVKLTGLCQIDYNEKPFYKYRLFEKFDFCIKVFLLYFIVCFSVRVSEAAA